MQGVRFLGTTGDAVPRPLTHDLFLMALGKLGVAVKRVIIGGVALNIFYATIELEQNGKIIELDARPSDGVALALRARVPLLAAEELLTNAPNV